MINGRRNWFSFNGINSFEFKSLVVNELPAISRATQKVTQYEVDGRDGTLNVLSGKYEPVVKSIKCGLKNLSELDDITAWLNGSGKVTFSNQPDRFFDAIIINQIDFERVARQCRSFIIQLECQPFGYSLDNEEALELTAPTTILNSGNTTSQPTITVYGKGDCTLTVNGEVITLTGIEDKITIDSSLMICHKDGIRVGRKMKGYFPELNTGENTISWTGNVSKVEIVTNSKYL